MASSRNLHLAYLATRLGEDRGQVGLLSTFTYLPRKAKSRPQRSDTTGLSAFRKTYPSLSIKKGAVLCLSETVYALSEHDYALPWNLQAIHF